MKKLLLLISLTGALFANEIVAQKEASKFLDALKKMDYKVVNSMIEKNKKNCFKFFRLSYIIL